MKDHAPRFLAVTDAAKARVREMSPAELIERIASGQPPVIIDVREESEWAAGHVPDALHLSRGVLERDIEAHLPDPDTELVLYCGGGYRSALSADSLQQMGYRQVWSLAGGRRGWLAAGGAWTTSD